MTRSGEGSGGRGQTGNFKPGEKAVALLSVFGPDSGAQVGCIHGSWGSINCTITMEGK